MNVTYWRSIRPYSFKRTKNIEYYRFEINHYDVKEKDNLDNDINLKIKKLIASKKLSMVRYNPYHSNILQYVFWRHVSFCLLTS